MDPDRVPVPAPFAHLRRSSPTVANQLHEAGATTELRRSQE
jgi:hypothetical protein